MSTEAELRDHIVHASGVAAILSVQNSPFDLLAGKQRSHFANSGLLKGPLKVYLEIAKSHPLNILATSSRRYILCSGIERYHRWT
jgi:hypothetical protein